MARDKLFFLMLPVRGFLADERTPVLTDRRARHQLSVTWVVDDGEVQAVPAVSQYKD